MALAAHIAALSKPRPSLAIADVALIARDHHLPALSWLLDPTYGAEFAGQLPSAWRVERISVEYLRYKPHTSCLAKLRLHTASGEASAYAIAVTRLAWGKLGKAIAKCERSGGEAAAIPSAAIAIFRMPYDREIAALRAIDSQADRDQLFHWLGGEAIQLVGAELEPLRYKPERRFVGKLTRGEEPVGVLRVYTAEEYPRARKALKWLGSDFAPARCFGASDRHAVLVMSWVPGSPAAGLLTSDELVLATNTLCALHQHQAYKLPHLNASVWRRRCKQTFAMLEYLTPGAIDREAAWLRPLAEACDDVETTVSLHGDAHAGQFLFGPVGDPPFLIDLDNACQGPAEWDFAVLVADQLSATLRHNEAYEASELIESVATAALRRCAEPRLRSLTAIRLLELAAEPFRRREPNWSEQAVRLIALAASVGPRERSVAPPRAGRSSSDRGLLALDEALDPSRAAIRLASAASGDCLHSGVALSMVRLLRHKPGRRALVEYVGSSRTTGEPLALLGKIEAKPRYAERLANQQLLWRSGFYQSAEDGIVVAEPWGVISEWQMWLQVRVPGARAALAREQITGPDFLHRAAHAIAKLHRTHLTLERQHTPEDEQKLLAKRFKQAAEIAPEFTSNWLQLAANCEDVLGTLPAILTTSVHRDFYSDQVLISPTQTALVDFDLLCLSDPALDVGNFLGCLADRAVRESWPDETLRAAKRSFLDAYELDNSGEFLWRVECYAALALARHATLSLTLPGRRESCGALVAAATLALEG
jgi:aminoglycoside phosphotransferase (APT) family kinase protein